MIRGKEATEEEFVLHCIATESAPSILSDFRAVLQGLEKQDKNIHIHGDRDKIERGVDDSGRMCDRIYHDQEL